MQEISNMENRLEQTNAQGQRDHKSPALGNVNLGITEKAQPLAPTDSPNQLEPIEFVPTSEISLRQSRRIVFRLLRASELTLDVFSFGRLLVRITRTKGEASLEVLSPIAFRQLLDAWIPWRKRKRGDLVAALPPMDKVRDLLELDEFPRDVFPPLDRIAVAPFVDKCGRLVLAPGYDATSRSYLALPDGFRLADVPDVPSPDDVDHAKRLILDELLGDFAFESKADLANAVALLIVFFVRPFVGHVPLFLIDAPVKGSGKTLLVKSISQIATGSHAPIGPMPDSQSEMRKKITTALKCGERLMIFDNVSGAIRGDVLCSATTASEWIDRELGSNKLLKLPMELVFMATGNNARVEGDMVRRTIRVRLNAHVEHPYLRPTSNFRHPDLIRWTEANRAALVRAILVLIRSWQVRGSQTCDRTIGSFESFCQTVGGILDACGIEGFLENTFLGSPFDEDDSHNRLADFVEHWSQVHEDRRVHANVLAELPMAKSAFPTIVHGPAASLNKRLGNQLTKLLGRVIAGFEICAQLDTRGSRQEYWLEKRSEALTGTPDPGNLQGPWLFSRPVDAIDSPMHLASDAGQ